MPGPPLSVRPWAPAPLSNSGVTCINIDMHRRNKQDGALANVVRQGPSLGEVKGMVRMTDEEAAAKAASGEALVQKKLAPRRVRGMMRAEVFQNSVRSITTEFDRLAISHPRQSDEVLRNMLRKKNRVAKEFDRAAPDLYNTVAKRHRTRQEEMTVAAMYHTLVGREKNVYRTDEEAQEAFRAAIIPYHLKDADDVPASADKQEVVVEQDEELEAVIEQSTSRAQMIKQNAKHLFHDGTKADRLAEIAAETDQASSAAGAKGKRVPRRLQTDSRRAALERLQQIRDRAEQLAGSGSDQAPLPPMIPEEGNEILEAPALPEDPDQARKMILDKMESLKHQAAAQANVDDTPGQKWTPDELRVASDDLEARHAFIERYGSFPFPQFLPPFPQPRDMRTTWLRVRRPGDLPSRSVPYPVAPFEDWDTESQDVVMGVQARIADKIDQAQAIMNDKRFDRSKAASDGAVRASVRTVTGAAAGVM
jgi:hypothetical protein